MDMDGSIILCLLQLYYNLRVPVYYVYAMHIAYVLRFMLLR